MDSLSFTLWPRVDAPAQGKLTRDTWPGIGLRLATPFHKLPNELEDVDAFKKATLPLWHFATFNGPRSKAAVDLLFGLWLDWDSDPRKQGPERGNVGLTYADVERAFGGVQHLAYTTAKHRPGMARWKVLLVLSRPVTPAEHARLCDVAFARAETAGAHGLDADPSWREPDRWAFVPCAHEHYEHYATGAEIPPVDVDAWLDEADALAKAAEAATWPEPEPLEAAACDHPFPVAVLPPVLREVVDALAVHLQVPPTLPASVALGLLAGCVSAKAEVEEVFRVPLVLWTCVVLRPSARKSPVFRELRRALDGYEAGLRERWSEKRQEVETTRRRLKEEARQVKGERRAELLAQVEEHTTPAAPCVSVGDATPEGIAAELEAQGGRLLVASDEGVFFQHLAGLYSEGGANLDALLQGFDGGRVVVRRRGAGLIYIPRAYLCVALAIQPSVMLKATGNAEVMGRGAGARFLWAVPPDRVGYRNPDAPRLDAHAVAGWDTLVRGLLAEGVPEVPRVFHLDGDGRAKFRTFRVTAEQARRPGGGMARTDELLDWSGKADGAVLRVAGVLHLARYGSVEHAPGVIAAHDVAAAVAIVEHYAAHAAHAFAALGLDPTVAEARRLWAWLDGEPELHTFTVRDAHRRLQRRGLKVSTVEAAVELLEARGYVRRVESDRTPAPGRPPSPTFLVNPRARRA